MLTVPAPLDALHAVLAVATLSLPSPVMPFRTLVPPTVMIAAALATVAT